jgi:hypothetical protein
MYLKKREMERERERERQCFYYFKISLYFKLEYVNFVPTFFTFSLLKVKLLLFLLIEMLILRDTNKNDR